MLGYIKRLNIGRGDFKIEDVENLRGSEELRKNLGKIENFLLVKEKGVSCRKLMADVYLELGEKSSAEKLYLECLEAEYKIKTCGEALLRLYLEAGDRSDAIIQICESHLSDYLDNEQIFIPYVCGLSTANPEKAVRIIREHGYSNLNFPSLTQIANILLSLNQVGFAKELCAFAYEKHNHWQFAHTLSLCYLSDADFESARYWNNKALKYSDELAVEHCNISLFIFEENYAAAESALSKLVGCGEKPWELYFSLGATLSLKGDYSLAKRYLESAVELGGAAPELYLILAQCFFSLEDYEEAEYFFRLARDQGSTENSVRYTLALAEFLYQMGIVEEGKELFDALMDAHGTEFEVLHDYGISLYRQGYLEESLDKLERCVSGFPESACAYNSLGACLRELGRFDEADKCFDKAAVLWSSDPVVSSRNFSVDALEINRVMLKVDFGQFDGAVEHFNEYLKKHPQDWNVKWYRGVVRLASGDFLGGWEDYESRWATHRIVQRPFNFEDWRGIKVPNDELLIFGEQGIGDEVMFASCIPDFSSHYGGAVVECDMRLKALFERSFPDFIIVGRNSAGDTDFLTNFGQLKYQVPIGSLPLKFRKSLSDFERRGAYLIPDQDKVIKWKNRLKKIGSSNFVGISWRGGTKHTRKAMRSIPLADWGAAMNLTNIEFVSLQYGDVSGEIRDAEKIFGRTIHTFSEAVEDFEEYVALICALDCVLSVQTALVHLAGALGQRVLCMLPASPEWRYRMGKEKMIWYENVKLIKQEQNDKDWNNVLGQSVSYLEKILG